MANIFFRCDFSSVPTGEREREGNKKKKKDSFSTYTHASICMTKQNGHKNVNIAIKLYLPSFLVYYPLLCFKR